MLYPALHKQHRRKIASSRLYWIKTRTDTKRILVKQQQDKTLNPSLSPSPFTDPAFKYLPRVSLTFYEVFAKGTSRLALGKTPWNTVGPTSRDSRCSAGECLPFPNLPGPCQSGTRCPGSGTFSGEWGSEWGWLGFPSHLGIRKMLRMENPAPVAKAALQSQPRAGSARGTGRARQVCRSRVRIVPTPAVPPPGAGLTHGAAGAELELGYFRAPPAIPAPPAALSGTSAPPPPLFLAANS